MVLLGSTLVIMLMCMSAMISQGLMDLLMSLGAPQAIYDFIRLCFGHDTHAGLRYYIFKTYPYHWVQAVVALKILPHLF